MSIPCAERGCGGHDGCSVLKPGLGRPRLKNLSQKNLQGRGPPPKAGQKNFFFVMRIRRANPTVLAYAPFADATKTALDGIKKLWEFINWRQRRLAMVDRHQGGWGRGGGGAHTDQLNTQPGRAGCGGGGRGGGGGG